MESTLPPFSLVIPVRDEEAALRRSLPALLRAMEGLRARPIWVCNGCNDDSASVIAMHAGSSAEILVLDCPGKTQALQAGDDALGDLFPRLYLDADVILQQDSLPQLLRPLLDGSADLIAARINHATEGVSPLSAAIARCWEALPYARQLAFLGVVGLSAAGRKNWECWPLVTGDDIFVSATVPPERSLIVAEVVALTCPPSNFAGWIRRRARWLKGERELRAMGLSPRALAGQRQALMRLMLTPDQALGAWAFASARLLATVLPDTPTTSWIPDRRGMS